MVIFFIFILGLIIGSFLNAYIWRLKTGKSVWRGRSCCPKCGKTLAWFELIPLVSFIIQKGRCRGCREKIDWQYPMVELATAVLFALAFNKIFNFQFSIFNQFPIFQLLNLILLFYFFSILMVLFVYDLRHGLIPNKVVLPAIFISLVFNIIFNNQNYIIHNTLYFLLAMAVGAGFFAIQYYVSRGRWVGVGDIYFGALMGAMLGWPQVIVGLVISYMLGGFFAAVLLLLGKKKFGQTLPMGTFLAIGTVTALLWGREILSIYWPR